MERRILWIIGSVLLSYCVVSCKQEPTMDPLEEVDSWTKDTVMKVVESSMWRVQHVFLVTGDDTVNLAETNFENRFLEMRHEIILGFWETYLPFWSAGEASADTEGKFKKTAEIHHFTERSVNSSDLRPSWNDTLNTLQVTSSNPGLLQIPQGFTANLVKSRIVNYKSYQEEETATKPSCLLFEVKTNFGTYLFEMRQVWRYETDPIQNNFARYVVFP
jgi:hypothetical protein